MADRAVSAPGSLQPIFDTHCGLLSRARHFPPGQLDAIYAVSDLIACWVVASLPLGERLVVEREPDLPEFGLPTSVPRS
jgi:hypothetical protein